MEARVETYKTGEGKEMGLFILAVAATAIGLVNEGGCDDKGREED